MKQGTMGKGWSGWGRSLVTLLFLVAAGRDGGAWAAEPAPWRLAEALDLPEWLRVSGSHRVRYETLDGQFRAGGSGGDQALALQTLLLTDIGGQSLGVVLEGVDSRVYLADSGTPTDNRLVDAVDVLQAHVRWRPEWPGGGTNVIRVGRETLDLGGRRLVARNAFRNTINAFTGIDAFWQGAGGASLRGFYLLPVRRLPEDLESGRRNEVVADTQSFDQQLYGAFADLPVPGRWEGIRFEGYYLRLLEEAEPWLARRRLHTPGVRVLRPPATGRVDFEWESDVQFGSSRVRSGAGPDLDHFAHHHHLGAGYTFDVAWRPRLGVRYDYASGDADPNDRDNGRFDTLFGARRWEFGPTDIFGAVARANLNSPEYSVSVRPSGTLELSVSHRWVWLAEARDAWTAGGVRDVTGASGTEVGQQVDLRIRWDAVPRSVRFDAGLAHLFAGEFLRRAPNSTRQGDANFVYVEVGWAF